MDYELNQRVPKAYGDLAKHCPKVSVAYGDIIKVSVAYEGLNIMAGWVTGRPLGSCGQ